MQSAHAAIDFCFEHPSRAGPWHKDSNYIVLLAVHNVKDILHLQGECDKYNLHYTIFREPDIGNEITAIAIEPSPKTKKLVQRLPLMFKNKIY